MKLNIQLFADTDVVVQVDLDSKTFDRKLAKLEYKLDEKELELKIKSEEVDQAQSKYDGLNNKLMEMETALNNNREKAKQLNEELKNIVSGSDVLSNPQLFSPGTVSQARVDTGYNTKVSEIQKLNQEQDKLIAKEEQFVGVVEKANQELDKKVLACTKVENEIKALKNEQKLVTEEVKKENAERTKSSGVSSNLLKSIKRMGLAVFGISSAYMLIRQSMNQVAQENDVIAAKLTTIKSSLANAIAPIAEQLVNIVYKLLAYLNVITKKFFGLDLFKKSEKSSKKTLGTAKKLSKTIAGFDEMDILNDNSGGGGGGSKDTEIKPPDTSAWEKIVDKVKEAWDTILETDRKEAAKFLLQSDTTWGLFKLGIWDYVQGWVRIFQGFIDTVKGIWDILVGWANDDDKKIRNGIKKLKKGIINILKGFVQVLIAPWEMFYGLLQALWNTLLTWFYNTCIKPVIDDMTLLWTKIKEIFKPAVEWFKNVFNQVSENVKIIFDNLVLILKTIWGGLKDFLIQSWDAIKKVFEPVSTFFKDKFTKAKDEVKNVFGPIVDWFGNLWTKIKEKFTSIGTKIGDAVGKAFKTVINKVIEKLEGILNVPVKLINLLIDVIRQFPGLSDLKKLKEIKLPRLAQGGIVNMPSKGIPVGNAIAGERGAEGVIPLTDSQQMALLGEAIGRYITINANITNTMNGRVISRELQKIQQENSFASNR